jgi:hypothetical protein
MNWEFILVLLIPVGVWVLSSLFKGADADEANRPRRGPGQGGRPRAASDIDRFLEEINRRRKESAERQFTPPQEVPVAEEVRRGPPPRAQTPRRRPGSSRPNRARPVRSVPDLVEVVAAPQVDFPTPAPSPVLSVEEVRPPVAMPSERFPATATLSRSVLPLKALLGTRENLRMVLVLREILGPPVCKRK